MRSGVPTGVVSTSLWVALRLARSPWLWAWLITSTLAWWALQVFRPLAIVPTEDRQVELLQEVAFMSTLAGALAGIQALWELRPILARCAPMNRLAVRMICLLTAELLYSLGIAATNYLTGHRGLTLPLLAVIVHVGLVGLASTGQRLGPWLQGGLLVLVVWLLPALFGGWVTEFCSPLVNHANGSILGPLCAWACLALALEPRTVH